MPPGGETVGCHIIRVLDSAGSTLVEWGRQQQQHDNEKCNVDDSINNDNKGGNYNTDDDDVDDDDVMHVIVRIKIIISISTNPPVTKFSLLVNM